ncbi:hypothetical protein BKM04_02575 [Pseudomonas syringae pv. syringae]|nr:hypothetical protein BKM04_02575 [Pseudomonas syringae pv. syringae]POD67737.1 hypothetical protein BKM06_02575 [Pseudomonas syringae pv. syringae]
MLGTQRVTRHASKITTAVEPFISVACNRCRRSQFADWPERLLRPVRDKAYPLRRAVGQRASGIPKVVGNGCAAETVDKRRLAHFCQHRFLQPPQTCSFHGDMRHLPRMPCQPRELQVDDVTHQIQRNTTLFMGVVNRFRKCFHIRQPILCVCQEQRDERRRIAPIRLLADPA